MAVPLSVFVYVGNLLNNTTVETLQIAFLPFENLTDIHIERDPWSGASLQHGRLMFRSVWDAEEAILEMNGQRFEDKPMLVCRYGDCSHELHHYQRSLTIRGIPKNTTDSAIRKRLADVGHILSIERVKLKTSSRYTQLVVLFDSTSAAQTAREQLHLQRWARNTIKVYPFKPKQKDVLFHSNMANLLGETSWTFVENLPPDVTERQMIAAFARYGRVTGAIIIRSNVERPLGWIRFFNPADLQHVVHRWENPSFFYSM